MNEYLIITGINIVEAFSDKKHTNLFVISGKSKKDAILKLASSHPDIDIRTPIHITKLDYIENIESVVKEKEEKEKKKKAKAMKKAKKKASKIEDTENTASTKTNKNVNKSH